MTRHDKLVETLAARTSTAAYAKMSFAAWNSNWSPSFPSLPTSLRFCSEGSFDQSISASAHKCKGMHRNLRNYSKCSRRFAWFWTQASIRVITDSARVWYDLNCIILHLLFRTASCCISRKVKDLIGRKYHQGRQILKKPDWTPNQPKCIIASLTAANHFWCVWCVWQTRHRPGTDLSQLFFHLASLLTKFFQLAEPSRLKLRKSKDCPIGIKIIPIIRWMLG